MKYHYWWFTCLFVISLQCYAEKLDIVTIDLAPFGYNETFDKVPRGIFFDFANQVVQEVGVEYDNIVKPYARVVHELKVGMADMTIMFPSDQVRKIAHLVEPILMLENIVVGLPSSRYDRYEDLFGKTLGSIREAVYDQRVSDAKDINLYYTNNYKQSINMLLAKRFEGIIGVKRSIDFELSRLGYSSDILGSPLNINKKQAWLLISNKANLSNEIVERIRISAVRLKKEHRIEQILKKYRNL